jgi:hypothetical protein
MSISVFLSHPRPASAAQRQFIAALTDYLRAREFAPRTLGITDYDMNAPMTAIRRLLLDASGVLTVALKRILIVDGQVLSSRETRGGGAGEDSVESVGGAWLTSVWSHIETAMAYQLGLPILHIRESGVRPDGLLERGIVGLCGPEFDLDAAAPEDYVGSGEWVGVSGQWEGYVRAVYDARGAPPMLWRG